MWLTSVKIILNKPGIYNIRIHIVMTYTWIEYINTNVLAKTTDTIAITNNSLYTTYSGHHC